MTDKQPEALRLADRLEADAQGVNLGAEGMGWEPSANNMHKAAAELRRLHQSEREGWRYAVELEQEHKRLHEVNAELVEALEKISIGGDPRWANDALDKLQENNND